MYIHLQAGCHLYFLGKMGRSPTVLRTSDFKTTALSEEKELCLQHFFFLIK